MQIELAKSYGFCFGVERAIKMAENSKDAVTYGPLIHNNKEIARLKDNFNVSLANNFNEIKSKKVIIRTHGIQKHELEELEKSSADIVDATCPFVKSPQKIVKQMSEDGYIIVIFGDKEHPEVKSVQSYAINKPIIVLNTIELQDMKLGKKIAIVSQTTKKPEDFLKIVNYLAIRHKEVRVFNTICNATFENQDAVKELSNKADVMIIIGGKNSSNTKQLFNISKETCQNSYLIESEEEIHSSWFDGETLCGIGAGASTPDWIVKNVVSRIKKLVK